MPRARLLGTYSYRSGASSGEHSVRVRSHTPLASRSSPLAHACTFAPSGHKRTASAHGRFAVPVCTAHSEHARLVATSFPLWEHCQSELILSVRQHVWGGA